MKEITEILRTEGILSQGFGISPKILYRDRRLTPEAKAIYGYIASFAGNGNSAFPSRDIMLEELGMSSKRYYKHFSLLQQYGYIRVTKQRDRFGSFDRNIYTIVSNPVAEEPLANERKPCEPVEEQLEISGTDRKQARRRRADRVSEEPAKQRGKRQALASGGEKDGDWLRETMAINAIVRQQPEDKKHLEKIYRAALDMAESEQMRIGGAVKSREQILTILGNLDADATRTVLFKFKKMLKNKEYKIRNVKAFLQTLICNSSFDLEDYITHRDAQEQVAKDTKEQERNVAEKKRRDEILEAHPELHSLETDYTEIMRKLTRATLAGDAAEKERLMRKRDEIELRRQTYLKEYGLPDIV